MLWELNLADAELIADYDVPSQEAFGEIRALKGYPLPFLL
jgi:hypothetical protein